MSSAIKALPVQSCNAAVLRSGSAPIIENLCLGGKNKETLKKREAWNYNNCNDY
jgi:hypothetical protein